MTRWRRKPNLCRRIERSIKELFVFVSLPAVPSDPPSFNNAAERSLRHLVISRKISGGTRSEQGSNSRLRRPSLAPSEPRGSTLSLNAADYSSLLNSELLPFSLALRMIAVISFMFMPCS